MGRIRVSLGGLMVAVGFIAADIAAIRWLIAAKVRVPTLPGQSLELAVFALGVLPMASVLVVSGLGLMRGLVRSGRCSPFSVGFQVVGWPSVLLFVAISAITPASIHNYGRIAADWTLSPLARHASLLPVWVDMILELTLAAVIFSLPELCLALLGGRLARAGGMKMSAEGSGMEFNPADRAISPSLT